MSVTSTMTEALRMVRNQESFLLLFFKKDASCLFLQESQAGAGGGAAGGVGLQLFSVDDRKFPAGLGFG